VLRVVPYSAAQLYSYEVFKKLFQDEEGHLTVQRRLLAGACAGMSATLVGTGACRGAQAAPGTRMAFCACMRPWLIRKFCQVVSFLTPGHGERASKARLLLHLLQ
jgi:hypothetical protein